MSELCRERGFPGLRFAVRCSDIKQKIGESQTTQYGGEVPSFELTAENGQRFDVCSPKFTKYAKGVSGPCVFVSSAIGLVWLVEPSRFDRDYEIVDLPA
jgi:hypothetical protein